MILDTDVIVAAIRSSTGASAEVIRRVLRGELVVEASVALVLEYEAVATRPQHLNAGGLSEAEALGIIDALASLAREIEIHFRWRPQLRDADDEMVLEAAINARNRTIVSFNVRDFAMAADKFGIALATPSQFLRSLK